MGTVGYGTRPGPALVSLTTAYYCPVGDTKTEGFMGRRQWSGSGPRQGPLPTRPSPAQCRIPLLALSPPESHVSIRCPYVSLVGVSCYGRFSAVSVCVYVCQFGGYVWLCVSLTFANV